MHHKLDIQPIPKEVLYVNELNLVTSTPYERRDEHEKALTGKTSSEGVFHSERGRLLAKKIVDFLLEDEGCAERFPYNLIEELESEFWLNDFKL